MVCKTIQVVTIPISVLVVDYGLTVNGSQPSQCAAPVGAAIGFYLKLTLVHTQDAIAHIEISLTTPSGTTTVTYSALFLSVGTKEYFLGYTAKVYQVGTVTMNSVIVVKAINK